MINIDFSIYPCQPKLGVNRRDPIKYYIYLLGKEGDDAKLLKVDAKKDWYHSSTITEAMVTVFDTQMQLSSNNSIHRDKNGTFIKKSGRQYRMENFV